MTSPSILWLAAIAAVIALGQVVSCASGEGVGPRSRVEVFRPNPSYATADSPFEPLPQSVELNLAAVELGRDLYADSAMSVNGEMTCFSCHDLAKGGTDGLPKAELNNQQTGQVNTGTIFNLAFNFRFNWNGKFATLLTHINGPVTSKSIMGMSWPELEKRIAKKGDYDARFRKVYGRGVNADSIRDAVTSFQLSLITPNAPFDRYLRGEASVMPEEALEGFRLFKSLGCASCHQGINIGGNLFAKIGVMGDYFADRDRGGRGRLIEADYGRYLVTQREEDRHVFRVPSLRNVACTAPYFHDGSLPDLRSAVVTMARYQLGRRLDEEQIDRLEAFLRTLTGEHEGRPLCDS